MDRLLMLLLGKQSFKKMIETPTSWEQEDVATPIKAIIRAKEKVTWMV